MFGVNMKEVVEEGKSYDGENGTNDVVPPGEVDEDEGQRCESEGNKEDAEGEGDEELSGCCQLVGLGYLGLQFWVQEMLDNLFLLNVVLLLVVGSKGGPGGEDRKDERQQRHHEQDGGGRDGNAVAKSVHQNLKKTQRRLETIEAYEMMRVPSAETMAEEQFCKHRGTP